MTDPTHAEQLSPGPWRWAVNGHPDEGDQVLVDATGDTILRVDAMNWNRADAAVIEKAPELLAALRKVTTRLRAHYDSYAVKPDDLLEAEALLKRIDEGTA